MKRLSLGEQDFRQLRTRDLLYVDKTRQLYDIWTSAQKYFFLSRPRRFGKSLTISTLKEIALGSQELFKDLWIADKIDWKQHPVIHISFDALSNGPGKLYDSLNNKLLNIAKDYNINLISTDLKDRFTELVKTLAQNNPVVFLIDEYDKPLIDHLENLPQAEANREILREFFEPLKSLTPYLRLVFLTGVSKFSRLSLFSTLNNLSDLTLKPMAATLCGYTEAEMSEHFEHWFQQIAERRGKTIEETRAQIKEWYNGYSWRGERVYNPWSVLNCCDNLRVSNYWFNSGHPSFLIKRLRLGFHYNLNDLLIDEALLEGYSLENIEYRSLLFQTGYLTIESEDEENRTMLLRYPNREVEESLLKYLLADHAFFEPLDAGPTTQKMARNLQSNDLEAFFEQLNALFATIPGDIFLAKYEAYYHSVIFLTFSLLGFSIRSEVRQSKGRLDAIVHAVDTIYIFEFKINPGSAEGAEAALQQIADRQYAAPYRSTGKKIVCIGVGLSPSIKGIGAWKTSAE